MTNKTVNLSFATLVLIIIEHFTFGRLLKRNELARRALGIATVLSMARALSPLNQWLSFFSLFLAAGTGLVASVVLENAIKEKRQISELKQQFS